MLEWIIRRSVANRFLVLMGVVFLVIAYTLEYSPYTS